MEAVGGAFHRCEDARQAMAALIQAGVAPDAIRWEVFPPVMENLLGLLGIPAEALEVYTRGIAPGDVLLVITTDALPAAVIADEIARWGGMVIRAGQMPTVGPGER
ncbi:MAG TPA: hypothetical protein VKY56_04205 [Chloroflexota bacterium]|nr:hypothetical protein [Chloroflexota bacterium]